MDSSFLPIIYAADTDDDWTDPATWAKANPSMGVTVPEDALRRACESAKQNPSEENSFRQLRLCQWVQQAVRWMPMHLWDACSFAVSEDALIGKPCYAGLDLSSTTDITALVLIFPPTGDCDKYQILPYFWLPEDNIELRVRRDHVPYDIWRSQGLFNVTEGNCIHYEYIENFIERLRAKFDIRELAFDRWGSSQIMLRLAGCTGCVCATERREHCEMAKVKVQIDEAFALRLAALADKTDVIVPKVLEAGGEVMLTKAKSNLEGVIGSGTKEPSRSTGELAHSLGLSPVKQDRKGDSNIKLGFAEPRHDGDSNAKIANILEYGKHGQPPKPFLKPAKSSARSAMLDAMKQKFDAEVEGL